MLPRQLRQPLAPLRLSIVNHRLWRVCRDLVGHKPHRASAWEHRGTGVVHIHLVRRNRGVGAKMGGAPSPNQPLDLLSHVEIELGVT
ncbi:hypothetical protein ACFX13_014378 [Malus domestica]